MPLPSSYRVRPVAHRPDAPYGTAQEQGWYYRGREPESERREMAAPAIAVERYRVEHGEGFTMPVVSMVDRRAAGNRVVRFVFQRHLETVLYGRSEGSTADPSGR